MWRVNKDGELELDIALPQDLGNVTNPPAIGYDHRIVVFSSKNIAAFDQKGVRLWVFEMPCLVKGSTITQDNEVVATCGSDIVAFSRLGSRRILTTVANDVISTAPTLTQDGNLLVAAGGYLYKFAALK